MSWGSSKLVHRVTFRSLESWAAIGVVILVTATLHWTGDCCTEHHHSPVSTQLINIHWNVSVFLSLSPPWSVLAVLPPGPLPAGGQGEDWIELVCSAEHVMRTSLAHCKQEHSATPSYPHTDKQFAAQLNIIHQLLHSALPEHPFLPCRFFLAFPYCVAVEGYNRIAIQ